MNPDISCVITTHSEQITWIKRAILSVRTQARAPQTEIILTCDRPSPAVRAFVEQGAAEIGVDHIVWCDEGDLGASRNNALPHCNGRYVAMLDADDLFGAEWLQQAYDYARAFRDTAPEGKKEDVIVHPEYMVMFGRDFFIHRCFGDDAPEFDGKDQIQSNQWSALAFAPKSVFERFPYRRAEKGYGYEDYMFNTETMGAGIAHRCPPASVHGIRIKADATSLANRTIAYNAVIPRMAYYDRRDIPDATKAPTSEVDMPASVHRQCMFMHHNLKEYQLQIFDMPGVRIYPRQLYWKDQAYLRDQIGDAKHVVLVNRLQSGGAEKYAIDWAAAVAAEKPGSVVIVETDPTGDSPQTERAEKNGIKVIPWIRQGSMVQPFEDGNAEHMQSTIRERTQYTLNRALIQCELESVFVCNSDIAWMTAHSNVEVMAKRVFLASFAVVPQGPGFTNCPAFHLNLSKVPPNLTLVTDNEAHADKLQSFGLPRVVVIHPKAVYTGPSKRSTMAKERFRVLWAGRGTTEKRPDVLPAIAAALGEAADLHVWGDVRPLNGPENLKYRGPFRGFESIDGSYDCYLMTSHTEGMPNTALEAVLAGLPVVGPTIGGLPLIASATYGKFDPLGVAQLVLKTCTDSRPVKELGAIDVVTKWADEYNSHVLAQVTK